MSTVISSESGSRVTAGQHIRLLCQADGARPAATIRWTFYTVLVLEIRLIFKNFLNTSFINEIFSLGHIFLAVTFYLLCKWIIVQIQHDTFTLHILLNITQNTQQMLYFNRILFADGTTALVMVTWHCLTSLIIIMITLPRCSLMVRMWVWAGWWSLLSGGIRTTLSTVSPATRNCSHMMNFNQRANIMCLFM